MCVSGLVCLLLRKSISLSVSVSVCLSVCLPVCLICYISETVSGKISFTLPRYTFPLSLSLSLSYIRVDNPHTHTHTYKLISKVWSISKHIQVHSGSLYTHQFNFHLKFSLIYLFIYFVISQIISLSLSLSLTLYSIDKRTSNTAFIYYRLISEYFWV